MAITIYNDSFNPYEVLQSYEATHLHSFGSIGAMSLFIGTMRDFNEGDSVKGMTLEYYPGMTEKQLDKILIEAQNQWVLIDSLIVHRVGNIFPKEPIVLVAVWSSHRGDAFDACRFIMEALKSKAPFWKKELLNNQQERWVEKNSDGYQAS